MVDNRRDPAAVHQEIDRTREELATAVDEIVHRVQPSRVARRSMDRVREAVGSTLGADSTIGDSVAFIRRKQTPELPSGEGDQEQAQEEGEVASYVVRRRLRKGPVIALAGVAVAGTVAVVLWRRRRD